MQKPEGEITEVSYMFPRPGPDIERMFGKLKNWRRVATRYDRLARNYLSGFALAAIIIAWT